MDTKGAPAFTGRELLPSSPRCAYQATASKSTNRTALAELELTPRMTGRFWPRGVKGGVALGISTVAWIVIFGVAGWIATEPSATGVDSLSSRRSTFTAVFVLSLWGWIVSTILLFWIFTAADWIRHRIVQK